MAQDLEDVKVSICSPGLPIQGIQLGSCRSIRTDNDAPFFTNRNTLTTRATVTLIFQRRGPPRLAFPASTTGWRASSSQLAKDWPETF